MMFKRLFNKSSVTPPAKALVEPTVMPVTTAPVAPVVNHQTGHIKERRLVPRPFPVPEVIEGDGGDTEWGLWEAANKQEAKKIK